MAWTTTTDVSAGSVLTATDYNDQVLGNLNQLRGDFATSRYTAASITINSTTWANIPAGSWDLTLAASAGDLVEVAASWIVGNTDNAYFDAVTIVSGSVVNSFGTGGAVNASGQGIMCWRGNSGAITSVGGSFFYTLAAGDISSNSVTVRLQYRTQNAVNNTIFSDAVSPMVFFARNHGPVEV